MRDAAGARGKHYGWDCEGQRREWSDRDGGVSGTGEGEAEVDGGGADAEGRPRRHQLQVQVRRPLPRHRNSMSGSFLSDSQTVKCSLTEAVA